MKTTFVDIVLNELCAIGAMLPRPFETPYAHGKRLLHFDPDKYRRTIRDLEGRGLVKVIKAKNGKFISLTSKGQLEALLATARMEKPPVWDGKWRLVMFDIPEQSKEKRHLFRSLLKQHGFVLMQASVYICPHPLNRSAIEYLKRSGLMGFIRIMKVDEIDDDKDLRKRFKL